MTNKQFLEFIIRRNARVVAGPSATRGRNNAGVGAVAREYLSGINLAKFATNNASRFAVALDGETEGLRRAFPPRASKNWGLARKLVNLFLRDCLYTVYLEKSFRLSQAEPLLELPLDSITGTKLCNTVGNGQHLRWRGVSKLNRDVNALMQAAASEEATRRKTCRVHLDAVWWSAPR